MFNISINTERKLSKILQRPNKKGWNKKNRKKEKKSLRKFYKDPVLLSDLKNQEQ